MGNVQLHIHIIQTILSQVLLCVLVHYHADTWMFEPLSAHGPPEWLSSPQQ